MIKGPKLTDVRKYTEEPKAFDLEKSQQGFKGGLSL